MLCVYVDPGVVLFKVYGYSGSLLLVAVSNQEKHGYSYILSVVCCVGSVSATSLSLVRSIPTECVRV